MGAHKAALDVTAHNIANASTPGYSRQQAIFSTTTPLITPGLNQPAQAGQLGTGVTISEIRRVRDIFLDYQLRPQLGKLGEWDERYAALSHAEKILNEPTEAGLSHVFSRFWEAWQELSKNPTSGAARAGVVETGVTLATSLNAVASQLELSISDLDTKARLSVNDINSLARQVAELNQQIAANVSAGLSPNDLNDRRDTLLDDLARITGFTPLTQPNGGVDIAIGGKRLVQGIHFAELSVAAGGQITWPDGTALELAGGRLEGVAAARQWLHDEFYARMNTLSTSLAGLVNDAHAVGHPLTIPNPDPPEGRVFFVFPPGSAGREARFIAVNPAIVADHALLRAAASSGALADGRNALQVARRRHAIIPSGATNLEGYYGAIVTDLGVEAQQAARMLTNQDALVNQLHNRRQEVAGVSIDEEMAAMIQFQHGYAAAARLLATLDEMLAVLINLGR
jgi:flagellar hook-associated protein 1 FlgK